MTAVLQRGAFRAEDIFDSRSSNKAVIDLEDLDLGAVICLLPVESVRMSSNDLVEASLT